MADNTQLNTNATSGDIIATDDIAGVKHQRVKVEFGVDGSATDVSATNPLPTIPPPISPVNKSGTNTLGGTAQTLAASNAVRRGWWLRNNSTASLWVCDITTAVMDYNCLEIKTGELYESAYGGCSSNALSIIGATTGQSFTAREY